MEFEQKRNKQEEYPVVLYSPGAREGIFYKQVCKETPKPKRDFYKLTVSEKSKKGLAYIIEDGVNIKTAFNLIDANIKSVMRYIGLKFTNDGKPDMNNAILTHQEPAILVEDGEAWKVKEEGTLYFNGAENNNKAKNLTNTDIDDGGGEKRKKTIEEAPQKTLVEKINKLKEEIESIKGREDLSVLVKKKEVLKKLEEALSLYKNENTEKNEGEGDEVKRLEETIEELGGEIERLTLEINKDLKELEEKLDEITKKEDNSSKTGLMIENLEKQIKAYKELGEEKEVKALKEILEGFKKEKKQEEEEAALDAEIAKKKGQLAKIKKQIAGIEAILKARQKKEKEEEKAKEEAKEVLAETESATTPTETDTKPEILEEEMKEEKEIEKNPLNKFLLSQSNMGIVKTDEFKKGLEELGGELEYKTGDEVFIISNGTYTKGKISDYLHVINDEKGLYYKYRVIHDENTSTSEHTEKELNQTKEKYKIYLETKKESLSADYIKKEIEKLLKNADQIEKVENLELEIEKDHININAEIKAKNQTIGLENVKIVNKGSSVEIESGYKIKANFVVKGLAGSLIKKNIKTIPEKLKSFIEENRPGKKVEKIQIEDGKLLINYK